MHNQPNLQPGDLMRDRDTVITSPHDVTVTWDEEKGEKHVEVHDSRTSVAMIEGGVKLTLFFPDESGLSGDADPVEIRLEPHNKRQLFDPWRLMPGLPLYVSYARAAMAWRWGDAGRALTALRELGATRRGHKDDFYRAVAELHTALVDQGEPHPVKALAAMQPVDISTASRWVKEARQRGYLKAEV
jgi:hypothetical protein